MSLMPTFQRFLSLSLLVACAAISVTAQINLQLNKEKIVLNPGQGIEIIASGSTNLELDKLKWTYNRDLLDITVSDHGGILHSTIKAKDKAIQSLFIYATYDGAEIKQVEVTILPAIKGDDLQFSPALTDVVVQNQTLEFTITAGNAYIDPAFTKVQVTPSDAATAYIDQGKLFITGQRPGNAEILILSNGQPVKSINVKILEAVNRIETIREVPLKIKIGQTKAVTELVSLVNDKESVGFKERLRLISKNSGIVSVAPAGDSITGRKHGVTEILIVPDGDMVRSRSVQIEVTALPDKIVASLRSLRLRKDEPGSISFDILSADGERIPGETPEIVLDDATSTPNFAEYIAFQKSGDLFLVRGLKRTDTPIQLKFKLAGTAIVSDVTVQVEDYRVTDFKPLLIRLDLLDERTAKDLFGKKAYDEYHIAKIRLFNAIQRRDGTHYGKPILVYSESLELRVALEYKSEKGGEWAELGPNNSLLRKYFPGPTITNLGGSRDQCIAISSPEFFVPYRPMTFEMVLNTYERRDDRNLRNRILLVANGVSSLASFVTAIAVPGANSDLPLGLDKFQNLLIPSFEKLFPSTREVQRQNIVSMVMRQLEEVPFGSDITRIVYIPKKSIKGLIPGYLIRISGVSITDACAETAIIDKTGSTL